jgi:hypothetical protein
MIDILFAIVNLKTSLAGGDSGDTDHLIPEQIDQVIVWRKTEQISWRSF